jgi:hypothetical protein
VDLYFLVFSVASPSHPRWFQATSAIHPLVNCQPQSLTTLPVANQHHQLHTMHPIPTHNGKRKPLYIKVVVIRFAEKCTTLNLKINDEESSDTIFFYLMPSHFRSSNYNSSVSVRNAHFSLLKRRSLSDSCTCELAKRYPSQVTCPSRM